MALSTPSATAFEGTASNSFDAGTGSDRLLLVCAKTLHDNSGDGFTGFTYNSVSLTAVSSLAQETTFGGRFGAIEWFYLIAPATGSNTLAPSTTGTIRVSEYTAIIVDGADQTTPVVAATTSTIDGSSASNTFTFTKTTGEANSILFAGGNWRGGDIDPFTPGTGETELTDGATGTNAFLDFAYTDVYQLTTSTGSYTISSTGSASDVYCASLIEIKPAGGGTEFSQSVAGSLTTAGIVDKMTGITSIGTLSSAGNILKLMAVSYAGVLSFVGSLFNKASVAFAGFLSSAGALSLKTLKILVGVLSSSGILTSKIVFTQSVVSALSFIGDLINKTGKVLVGLVSFSIGS